MLEDILQFAAEILVDNGRISMWMPVANDEDVALAIPRNPYLELRYSSVQPFNKWSRRLLTYQRLPSAVTGAVVRLTKDAVPTGAASELNNFRRRVSHTSGIGDGCFANVVGSILRASKQRSMYRKQLAHHDLSSQCNDRAAINDLAVKQYSLRLTCCRKV